MKSAYVQLAATSTRVPLSATQLVNADSPNLDAFAQRNGRLLIIHGLAEPQKLHDDWVESGTAPASYVAKVNPSNTALPASWSKSRARLVRASPREAHYVGGDAEAAGSFECR